MVDCAGIKFGNFGCNGGNMDAAFKYYSEYDAIEEANYIYTAKDGKCQYSTKKHTTEQLPKSGYHHDVTPDNKEQLMAAVVQQPVSIAIEAD